MLKKVGFLAIACLGFIVYSGFSLPFNQIRCGDQTYAIYTDVENPLYMYNINNSKMFWKWTSVGKSIQYAEVKNNVSTILHIHKNGIIIPFQTLSSGTVDPEYYSNFINNHISFLPYDNLLENDDLNNLKLCYPESLLELETDIKSEDGKIGGRLATIK